MPKKHKKKRRPKVPCGNEPHIKTEAGKLIEAVARQHFGDDWGNPVVTGGTFLDETNELAQGIAQPGGINHSNCTMMWNKGSRFEDNGVKMAQARKVDIEKIRELCNQCHGPPSGGRRRRKSRKSKRRRRKSRKSKKRGRKSRKTRRRRRRKR
ncbi:MAG: hypothetical protein CML42_07965 [Rhodobacteraceae bacterium]|nr:hypothetical protein [Paracoccaceae bacterium]|tara:strand:- start:17673 stop:18131 length:459 start_codon:yes stop_codon:yes gene_type:complete